MRGFDVARLVCAFRVHFHRQSSHFSSIGVEGRECLHDHLLAGKQRVADELASPQSNGSVGHVGGGW